MWLGPLTLTTDYRVLALPRRLRSGLWGASWASTPTQEAVVHSGLPLPPCSQLSSTSSPTSLPGPAPPDQQASTEAEGRGLGPGAGKTGPVLCVLSAPVNQE